MMSVPWFSFECGATGLLSRLPLFFQEVKELIVLFVQWVAGDEPALYLLDSEELATNYFGTLTRRRGLPCSAFIVGPNACPSRKKMEISLRWVKGKWK